MKRNNRGKSKNIDWKYCFICQNKRSPPDNTTEESLKTLCGNLTQIWELGELDLEWESMATVMNDDGKPDLFASVKDKARFHRKCKKAYDKQKIDRILAKRNSNKDMQKPGPSVTRSSIDKQSLGAPFCAICGELDEEENLHAAGTLHATKEDIDVSHNNALTTQWKSMAIKVGNERLLNILSSGDTASNELFYHGHCNVEMWNECNKIDANKQSIDITWKKAQAFHSVVTHVIEKMTDDAEISIPVKELNQLYIDNLKELGIEEHCQTTRFAERLVNSIPNLVSTTVNSRLYVLRSEKVEELVSSHVKCPDTYLASLQAIAHPIRVAISELENSFKGHFDGSSQVGSVPKILLLLIMLLIDGCTSMKPSQEALSVAQLITYHANINQKSHKKQRHKKCQETPLMIYTGLKVFFLTRSRKLIDGFFKTGLSISYDRVLELTKILYQNLHQAYTIYGCFFPRILKKQLFSVWLKDNIDVNPKANFAKSSYHGTSSSMIQFATDEEKGEDFPRNKFENKIASGSKKLMPLPPEYTTVENLYTARSKSTQLWAPKTPNFTDIDDFSSFNNAVSDELSWLIKFNCEMEADTLPPAWAGYHAAQKRGVSHPPGINTILPLLRDKVHTLNTQSHIMKQNIKWTEKLNPGQTPVDVSDQPVYALTKELQYRYPDEFSNYFALFGQLHIEQALLVVHGLLIKGSGLFEILTQNKFSTIGMGAAVDVNNIKRARYALQLSLCSLFSKLEEAAGESMSNISAYDWLCQKSVENEVYLFWKMVMELEMYILIYIRSIREGNFKLYIETLRKLLKWFFIFDRYNYARWLTIQWFDLKNLESNFPDVYEYFCKGFFSFQKSNRQFSQIGLDQVHEQNNAVIKGSGGATDLLNKVDESALLRWEVCNPEVARLLLEFEDAMDDNPQVEISEVKHHEDNDTFKKNFVADVKVLCKGFAMNPFLQDKLKKLNNSKISFPEKSIEALKGMEIKGEEDVVAFITDRLVSGKVSICDTIKNNDYDLWNESPSKKDKIPYIPSKSVLNKMKSACEYRSDMALELFEGEIMNIPQSLTPDGVSLYHGTKSDIAKRFNSQESIPEHDCKSAIILDMSPIIRAKSCSSGIECFSDFAVILYHHIMKLSHGYDRIDLVFDRYFQESLKEGTRNERGSGSMFVFEGDDTPIPNNMEQTFMKESKNKNELNEYLAKKLIELHKGPQLLIATWKDTVLCYFDPEPLDQSEISITKCQSEEADQRIIRHVLHTIDNYAQFKRIVVNTIDTDVLVLLISYVGRVEEMDPDMEIFAYLTSGKKYYNITEICNSLGKEVCLALPFFYCLTGCDTVSSLTGKGKCKAWDRWFNSENKDEFTTVFKDLGNQPKEITSAQMDKVEEFIRLLYAVSETSLGADRLKKFQKSTDDDLRKLPPSREALLQHTKRSCYQAGYIWQECLADLQLPDPKLWGWLFDEIQGFIPCWLSVLSSIDLEKFVTTCTCKTGKCERCKCATADITCIRMCGCNRVCDQRKKENEHKKKKGN